MIEIVINDRGTTAALQRIAAQINNPIALLKVLGRRGSEELRRHFRSRDTIGNKLGGHRTHFWRQVADAVNNPAVESNSRVRISINHPAFAQKVFGGTIIPQRAKMLTIPVNPAAHGLSVSSFQHETGLKLFRLRKKGGGLTRALAAVEESGRVTVFYVLADKVRQDPDPGALPPFAKFRAAIVDRAEQELANEIKNA
jgi:hypothetical protein